MFQLQPLYRTAQVREIDAQAIAGAADDGYGLMQRAARFAVQTLQQAWPAASTLSVLAGPGNNGGDALVLARMADAMGYQVRTWQLDSAAPRPGSAMAAATADFHAAGLHLESGLPQGADVLVDGLFGTGLTRALRGRAADWVDWLNQQRSTVSCGVLALDIPSGLNADSGNAEGVAVSADHTCTFVARKFGLDLGAAVDACGQVHFSDLGIPATANQDQEPVAWRVRGVDWPRRRRGAHKGDAGHVLCVGGAPEYAGALVLAAQAALRAGTGKVSLLSRSDAIHPGQWPELMRRRLSDKNSIVAACADTQALCVGPGLGRDDEALGLLEVLRRAPQPQVWDADALWALAQHPTLRPATVVLTPHPGEAGLLLGLSTAAVQADREEALRQLVQRWQCPVVLKGARTLVGAPGQVPVVVAQGYPGMGVGGMGDVLAGLIGGLLAQGFAPVDAAIAGPWWMAQTADDLRAQYGVSLLPSDVVAALGRRRWC